MASLCRSITEIGSMQRTSSLAFAVPQMPKLARAYTADAIMSSKYILPDPSTYEDPNENVATAAAVIASVISRVSANAELASGGLQDECRNTATVYGSEVRSWKCCICLEQHSGLDSCYEGLCGSRDCNDAFCGVCVSAYFADAASYSRFTVLPIRCPAAGCKRRVPTERWAKLAPSESFEAYEQGARASLNFRCPECHEAGSLLVDHYIDGGLRTEAVENFLALYRRSSFAAERALRRRWRDFAVGIATPNEMLDALLAVLGCASILDLKPAQLRGALSLIPDVERRCALHLACVRRHPQIWTPCCGAAVCLRCQLAGHHEGMTCEEVQRDQLEVECQFCPSCGVATQKTEGCSHIICLCGADWEWKEEFDGSAEDWAAPAPADDWGAPAPGGADGW